MAQATPTDRMSPAELTEEFRVGNQLAGKQREQTGSVDPDLSRRLDLVEQEIIRRIAW